MPDPGGNRPNFYVALGLDPDEPYSEGKAERALSTARNRWSKDSSNSTSAKRKGEAVRHLPYVSEMKRVMLGSAPADRAEREQHAAQARDLRAQEDVARRAEFTRRLDLLLDKGYLLENEVAELTRAHPDLVAEPAISRRLADAPRQAGKAARLPERLPRTIGEEIERLLDQLGEESLYTLLSKVDPTVGEHRGTTERLRAAADTLYRDMNVTHPKTPVVTAKTNVSGHAKNIFSSSVERAKYDATRLLAPVDGLLIRYRGDLGQARAVSAGQYARFLREVRERGFDDLELARAALEEFFGVLGWPVAPPPPAQAAAIARLVPCHHCELLLDPDQAFCPDCSAPQRIRCPGCGGVARAAPACADCGFPVGERDFVLNRLAEAERLIEAGDLTGAAGPLQEAGTLWPLPEGGTDEIAVRIRAVSARRAKLLAGHQQTLREIADLRAARRLRALEAVLLATDPAFPDRAGLIADVQDRLAAVDAVHAQSRRPDVSADRRAELLAEVVAACADHPEAAAELRQLPPRPPAALTARIHDDTTVRLRWRPSATVGVRYVVLRKAGGRSPRGPFDGTRVATVTTSDYEDTSPERGVALRYAVFVERDGVASQAGTVSTGTVFLTDDVVIGSRTVRDGETELGWQLPPHARGVTIHRTAGVDGVPTPVTPTSPTSLRDRDVRNGVSYSYLIRAIFTDEDGVQRLAPGTSVSLTPNPPPQPVGSLLVATRSSEFGLTFSYRDLEFRWKEPGRGSVALVQTDRHPIPLTAGDRVDARDLDRYGIVLRGPAPLGVSVLNPGLYAFIPVTEVDGLGHVGRPRFYAAAEEAGRPRAVLLDSRQLEVSWDWPEGCRSALLTCSAGGRPDDELAPDTAATPTRVDRSGASAAGRHTLTVPPGLPVDDLVVAIYALAERDAQVYATSGVRVRPRPPTATLSYTVSGARRKGRVQARVSAPVDLPELVVVLGSSVPPVTADDGQELYRRPAGRAEAGELEPIPLPRFHPGGYVRVFAVRDDTGLVVLHPPAAGSRLG